MIAPIEHLVEALSRLPGLGRRSAGRAALALVRDPLRLLVPLSDAMREARESVVCCSRCGAFTTRERNPCSFCSDVSREGDSVCVVEEPADVLSIEASGAFRGRYHVLGGKLSPARHLGPDRLRFAELKERIANERFSEVLVAVSTDMEGDATAGYLAELLANFPSPTSPVKIMRLAFGLPTDSGVAYSDPLTLRRAIAYRQPLA